MTVADEQTYVTLNRLLDAGSKSQMAGHMLQNLDFTINVSIERLRPEQASILDDISGIYVKGKLERYVKELASERGEKTSVYYADDLINSKRMWNDLLTQSRFNPVYVVGDYEEMNMTNIERRRLSTGCMNTTLHHHLRKLREDNDKININTFTLNVEYADVLPPPSRAKYGNYHAVLEKGGPLTHMIRAFATVPGLGFLYNL